jgi:hypothetical protein
VGRGGGPHECGGDCASSPGAASRLEGDSEDGSIAVFSSTQRLTNSAGEDDHLGDTAQNEGCERTIGANGCNLYAYDFDAPENERLTAISASEAGSPAAAQVQGVMAVSTDGSHVYFVAKGALTGENGEHRSPTEGADNLYVYEHDERYPGGHLTFIATLPGDGEATEEGQWKQVNSAKVAVAVANVTPDGRFLVFMSNGALTADTAGRLGGQLYRYDAEEGTLLRVSIGQRGYDDDGNAGVGQAELAKSEVFVGQPRRDSSMSDNGEFVFFQSPVGLTPGALADVRVNKRGVFAENVYEWEASGEGTCREAAGCVSLISDGLDVSEGSGLGVTESSVELVGSDASGENVFFTTAQPLVPAVTDSALNYYDARVNGGFPAPTQHASCAGEECYPSPPLPPPLVLGGIGSELFVDGNPFVSGNLSPVVSGKQVTPVAVPLSRAQKLAKALRVCRRERARHQRTACERVANKRFGPVRKRMIRHAGRRRRR